MGLRNPGCRIRGLRRQEKAKTRLRWRDAKGGGVEWETEEQGEQLRI
jgi:hypothetical protein